jgi:hypothetical protein
VHAIKAHGWSRSVAPLPQHMKLSDQVHSPAVLIPGKNLGYPFTRRPDGLRGGSLDNFEIEKFLLLPGMEHGSSSP